MAHYLVWSGENEGDLVKADKILVRDDVVLFLIYPDGKVVKTYPLEDFIKYNPDWKLPESI